MVFYTQINRKVEGACLSATSIRRAGRKVAL
jgi:hypothetical protein